MMSRGRLALSLVVASAICISPISGAVAQTPADKEQAAKLYKEGVESYFAADYAVAITKFREGFDLDPNAMFLYNLSLCFSKLGNPSEALVNAERAAELGGMPEEAERNNKARLAAFSTLVKSEHLAEEAAAAPLPGTCATNSECGDGEVCNMRRGICVEELPSGAGEPSESLFGPVGWAGVGTAGLGIALLATGGIFSVQVAKTQGEYDDAVAANDTATANDKLETLRNQKRVGAITLLSGIGATAIGAGLIVVDLFVMKDEEAPISILLPYAAPGEAGFSYMLRF